MSDLVVASNRGPVSYAVGDDGEPVPRPGAGGLAPSLASALEGSGATWVAAALSEGDRLAAARAPLEVDGIAVRLLEIPPETYRAAYNVVANGTLWFLQHDLYERARRPAFDARWYEAFELYREYNRAFAAEIAGVAPAGATVLVHDYHLSLCGADLLRLRPDLRTVHFTHTPWCEPSQLRMLPGHAVAELLGGMTSYGACGFHTRRWESAFAACCRELAGRDVATFASPLGVDAGRLRAVAASAECAERRAALEERTAGRRMILRSDRVELSKNLVRGFRAYGEMLERYPEWRGEVVFVALAYGSREELPEYLAYRAEVERVVEIVNERHGTATWTPIELEVSDDFVASVAALTSYDVLLVNPIRDGLNLVAKEGTLVNDCDGVLALSREAGVFEEMGELALEVHPYDVVQTAEVLARALEMEPAERRRRAAALREVSEATSPATWLEDLVSHARTAAGPA